MSSPARPRVLEWLGVALCCGCAMLAATLEVLLVPLYFGSVLVPAAVVFAVASNVMLPRLARSLIPSSVASGLTFVSWLVVVGVFGLTPRPEGDVILPGGSGVEWVGYGVLLGGAIAGTVTVAVGGSLRVRG